MHFLRIYTQIIPAKLFFVSFCTKWQQMNEMWLCPTKRKPWPQYQERSDLSLHFSSLLLGTPPKKFFILPTILLYKFYAVYQASYTLKATYKATYLISVISYVRRTWTFPTGRCIPEQQKAIVAITSCLAGADSKHRTDVLEACHTLDDLHALL